MKYSIEELEQKLERLQNLFLAHRHQGVSSNSGIEVGPPEQRVALDLPLTAISPGDL
jgi:hypothetical protein